MANQEIFSNPGNIDYDEEHSYLLQWVRESRWARMEHRKFVQKVNLALDGCVESNRYEEAIKNAAKGMTGQYASLADALCKSVPSGRTNVFKRYTDLTVTQLASGYDDFDYRPYDPYNTMEPTDYDKYASMLEQIYIEKDIDGLVTGAVRSGVRYGGGYIFKLPYTVDEEGPDGKKTKKVKYHIKRLDSQDMLLDGTRFQTTDDRFIGFSEMISFRDAAEYIKEKGLWVENTGARAGEPKGYIKTLNRMDIPLNSLKEISLCTWLTPAYKWDNIKYDMKTAFSNISQTAITQDPKKRSESNYGGADIERVYMYDKKKNTLFVLLSQFYVMEAIKMDEKEIKFDYEFEGHEHTLKKKICLPCPIHEFAFEEDSYNTYPITPARAALDLFEQHYSYTSLYRHNGYIMSLITFISNSSNADELKKMMLGSGVILENIDGDIQTLIKSHDLSILTGLIQQLELQMQEDLNAYPPFAVSQMVNDRASAAESNSLQQTIAQGLALAKKNVDKFAAGLIRAFMLDHAILSEEPLAFNNKGEYDEAAARVLATEALIQVKSKNASLLGAKMDSSNAMAILGMIDPAKYLNQDTLAPALIDKAFGGSFSRGQRATFVKKPEITVDEMNANAMGGANMAGNITAEQGAADADPYGRAMGDMADQLPPEVMGQVMERAQQMAAGGENPNPAAQEANVPVSDPEQAGLMANDPALAEGMVM